MKACILAGGYGRELEPFTQTRQKSMFPILGRPLLEWIVEGLKKAGIVDLVMVTGYLGSQVREHFASGEKHRVKVSYASCNPDLGVEAAILSAKQHIEQEEQFLLVYGDIVADPEIYSRTLSAHQNWGADHTLCVTLSTVLSDFGVVKLEEGGRVVDIVEKPEVELGYGNYVAAGVYVVGRSLLDRLEEGLSLASAFRAELEAGREVYAAIWERAWVDLGRPWNIIEANQLMLSKLSKIEISAEALVERGVRVSGPLVVEKGAVVESGAVIRGPCYIDEEAYIGNNTLIRDSAYIGRKAIVGFSTEIKNSVLLDSCEIGGNSYIGDSVIGEGAQIRPGTVTMNMSPTGKPVKVKVGGKLTDSGMRKLGAFIGDGSRIGANVTFYPGVKVGSRATVLSGTVVDRDIEAEAIYPEDQRS